MNRAGPPKHRQPDLVVSTKLPPDGRKKHELYVARGNWRCPGRPQAEGETDEDYLALKALSGVPHFSVEGVCQLCKEYRGKR